MHDTLQPSLYTLHEISLHGRSPPQGSLPLTHTVPIPSYSQGAPQDHAIHSRTTSNGLDPKRVRPSTTTAPSWASPMSTRTHIHATLTHEHSFSGPLTRSGLSHDTYDMPTRSWTFRSLGPSSRHIHSHTNPHEGPSELWLHHPPEVPNTSHSLTHTQHSPATLGHQNPSPHGFRASHHTLHAPLLS